MARRAIAWLVATVAICAGLGWLYLLRNGPVLDHGPLLADALPLEQLAAHSAQPLLRVAVAWIPAGAAAALALAFIGRVKLAGRTIGLALLAWLIIAASAALSGAIAQNETVSSHLVPTLGHAGVWVEVGCVLIGSLLVAPAARGARPGTGAAASAG